MILHINKYDIIFRILTNQMRNDFKRNAVKIHSGYLIDYKHLIILFTHQSWHKLKTSLPSVTYWNTCWHKNSLEQRTPRN